MEEKIKESTKKNNRGITKPLHSYWTENVNMEDECSKEDLVIDFCISHPDIYLFGAGKYATIINEYLKLCGVDVVGVIESEKTKKMFEGKKVYSVEELPDERNKRAGVILAVKKEFQDEIIERWQKVLDYKGLDVFCFDLTMLRSINKLLKGRIGDLIRRVYHWEATQTIDNKSISSKKKDWKKIIVIQLEDAIGDTIWGSAFIRELRKNFPNSQIDLLANRMMKPLLDGCPYIDRAIYYPNIDVEYDTYPALERRVYSFSKKNVDNDYDVAFLVKALPIHERDQIENVLFAFWSGAQIRVAHSFSVFEREKYFDSLWSNLFPIRSINDKAEHDVMKDLSLLDACGLTYTDTSMELWLSDKDKKKAERLLNKKEGTKYIAFGLAGREPRRNWPAGYYVDLIEKLDKLYPEEIKYVLFGGDNAKDAADIVNTSKGSIIDLVGKTSLSVSAAVMGLCDLYVGADTSLMHMASASGIPVIELTANLRDGRDIDQGSVVRTGPWHVPSRTIFPKWALNGCTRRCILPYTHCITQIRVDEVFDAVVELLGEDK